MPVRTKMHPKEQSVSVISLLFNLYKTFIVLLPDEWNIWWQLQTLSSFIWWLLHLICLIIVFRITFYISSDKCLLDFKRRWLCCWKLAVSDNRRITFYECGYTESRLADVAVIHSKWPARFVQAVKSWW